MAKKPSITTISSGYASTTTLNANFEALKEAFENTLSRDGSTPNSMNADLDMNSNDILNASRILVGGVDYIAQANAAKTAAEAAQAAAELAETNAETSETNSATSAASASSSAASAAASLASTLVSEANAAASEVSAANSSSVAALNAASASASASSASTSASNASISEANSAASSSSASTAAINAQAAQAGAEAAYDSFDDRYLGAKASAPATDNDGDPLLTGALYYNTTAGQLYIWTGSAWDNAAFSASGSVTSFNTRVGSVTLNSTDVANAFGVLTTNNLSDLGDAATARTNLGLGTSDSPTFAGLTVDQGGTATINITSGAGSWGMLAFGDPDDADSGRFFYDHGSDALTTRTAATNRMQIAGNGDISFYEDTGTTPKFFWDASAEALGIGTTTPAFVGGGNPELTISGTISYFNLQGNRTAGAGNTTGQITSYNGSTAISRIATVLDSGTTDGAMLFSTASSGSIAERMRIDSSGNLLVGKTSDTFSTAGSAYRANGSISATASANEVLDLNRLSTDGNIMRFFKDGTAVGSIGAWSGASYIGSGDTGLLFAFGNDDIRPFDPSSVTQRDGAISLGETGTRFKDGHFSGTVNAANFNTTSDATLKTNVETLTGSLDAVKAMRGVSFDWIDSGSSEVGVIAQEVEAVIPDVVSTNDQGIKSVKYGNIVAVLIEAIKEQQAQIDELKAKLGQ